MTFETVIRWLAGLFAYTALGIVLYGIWRGTQREAGRTSGRVVDALRSPMFFLITTVIYVGICYLFWKPLPVQPSPALKTAFLWLGALVYFPGMGLLVWARLALGENYYVSSAMGAQLFAGHRLVTSGPYAIVRHPMYLGLIIAALGSLLIYLTWTTLFFVLCAPFTLVRARREEQALSAEFGDDWLAYCRRVPALFPRLRK